MSENSTDDAEADDTGYVHVEFYDEERYESIQDVKDRHEVTWKEIIECGARYLTILEKATQIQTEDAARRLLDDATETRPELIEGTAVASVLDTMPSSDQSKVSHSHGDTLASPKRDPDNEI